MNRNLYVTCLASLTFMIGLTAGVAWTEHVYTREYHINHMPPIPTVMVTPYADFAIQRVPGLILGKDSLYGLYDAAAGTVSINTGESNLQDWLTFYHERYHVIADYSKLTQPEALEEQLADMYAADQVWLMLHHSVLPGR